MKHLLSAACSLAAAVFSAAGLAVPAQAELTTCWSTTNGTNGSMPSFPCHVDFMGNHKFDVYFDNKRTPQRRMSITLDWDEERAYAVFPDGEKRSYLMHIDDDYDIRLSGSNEYQFAFSMPADLRNHVIQAVEGKSSPVRPVSRRGTLSDTPFRF